MSSLVDQLLGHASVREDSSVVPVVAGKRPQAGAPARREPPDDEEDEQLRHKAARRRSIVAGIIGTVAESDDEGIIPKDAKRVDTLTGGENIPGIRTDPLPKPERAAEPAATTNVSGEELISPTTALVAPDITPNVRVPIDPSQVPAPPQRPQAPPTVAAAQQDGARDVWNSTQHVMDVVLGRQNTTPQPGPNADMAEAMRIQAESIVQNTADPITIKAKAQVAMLTEQEGAAMPTHQEGDGRAIFNAFRRFNP